MPGSVPQSLLAPRSFNVLSPSLDSALIEPTGPSQRGASRSFGHVLTNSSTTPPPRAMIV